MKLSLRYAGACAASVRSGARRTPVRHRSRAAPAWLPNAARRFELRV